MQLSSPVFLVIGLHDGRFCGWNLQSNTFDYMLAHSHPVTAMSSAVIQNQLFLMSGDSQGFIKVFNANNFQIAVEGQVQNDPQHPH